MSGKGDTPRPCDRVKYAEGWERVFGKRQKRSRYDYLPRVWRDIELVGGKPPRATFPPKPKKKPR